MTVRGRRVQWRIALASGQEITAAADQRDYAALEAQELPGAITGLRFLAWSAAHRAGAYAGTFETFNTVDCVEVEDVTDYGPDPDGEGEGEQRLDPGRPAPPAGT